MTSTGHKARLGALVDAVNREARTVAFPTDPKTGKAVYTADLFGEDVFTPEKMELYLPKPIYKDFLKQIHGNQQMDRAVADSVAHAVRVWAMDRGATHFTHWFQPQTGATAEKHDSFLSMKISSNKYGGMDMKPIDAFSGSQLLQSEPDASSFPSGGMRTTFEARGYTIWDTHSPMFIQTGVHGTAVLYIPSVFISYRGEALDEKTILLRSHDVLGQNATELLSVIGEPANRVFPTLGTEQEFFLVDRALYTMRPDLKVAGRTLIGNVPAKHQQLEDHYFGRMPTKVMGTITEAEMELYKLGVPIKTRHNEVAPSQFEVAPVFEEASVAVDHNLLTMDVIHKVAHRHKLKALFHEKPFSAINGSGKHCNWSMSTDAGRNLLDPGKDPRNNVVFLTFLVAILNAVHKYSDLLRIGIASSSNDHRLGANEAPPAIISAFLGDQLSEILDAIEEGRELKKNNDDQYQYIHLAGTGIDLKVSTLPGIDRDLTDRNRTSPFAFTGNKFEFRAVGSNQSPSFPMALLAAAVADSCKELTGAIKSKAGSATPTKDHIMSVIKDYVTKTKSIRMEGDNYSDAWVKEAASRGLPNLVSSPDAFATFLSEKNVRMLTETKIFTKDELHSRQHILYDRYTKDLIIEGRILHSMIAESVLPAVFEYRGDLASTIQKLSLVDLSFSEPEKHAISQIQPHVTALQKENEALGEIVEAVAAMEEGRESAERCCKELRPQLEKVREASDKLEAMVADKHWPFPKYMQLLY